MIHKVFNTDAYCLRLSKDAAAIQPIPNFLFNGMCTVVVSTLSQQVHGGEISHGIQFQVHKICHQMPFCSFGSTLSICVSFVATFKTHFEIPSKLCLPFFDLTGLLVVLKMSRDARSVQPPPP